MFHWQQVRPPPGGHPLGTQVCRAVTDPSRLHAAAPSHLSVQSGVLFSQWMRLEARGAGAGVAVHAVGAVGAVAAGTAGHTWDVLSPRRRRPWPGRQSQKAVLMPSAGAPLWHGSARDREGQAWRAAPPLCQGDQNSGLLALPPGCSAGSPVQQAVTVSLGVYATPQAPGP